MPEEQENLNDHVAKHYEPGNVTNLAVYDERSKIIQHYLVSKPICLPESATDKSTRGYWAANANKDSWQIVFLKDTWRDDEDGAPKEGSTYEILNASCAQNVPTMCGHGDVRQSASSYAFPRLGDTFDDINMGYQKTVTQIYARASWSVRAGRKVRVKAYMHYRLVLEQAAVTLNDFKDSRELFIAAHDVITALRCARDSRLLHRDISSSNILLFRKTTGERRYGLLADWDACSTTDDQGVANDTSVAGTWPYLSAEAARGSSDFRHTLQDDIQSLLYVLFYCCLTLLPHADVEDLGCDVADFFDEVNDTVLLRKRGLTKKYWITNHKFAVKNIQAYHFEEGVERLLKAVFKGLHRHYLWQETHSHATSSDEVKGSEWTIEKMAQVFGDLLGNPNFFVDLKTDKWRTELLEFRKQLIHDFVQPVQSNFPKSGLTDDRSEAGQ
ncbi:hypothetical protein CONPUDRAFT_165147 [Coniophora puteana RWD-64-598 SS2]|uniref:Fungal-type protein kinase domain-containing protein n=1 Tax=Coniophora puteana (strain RWD-64-598) TaxID=741705 RepID=A0A5M3MQV2_CONPW|nr:uncharacterized protein CONPUDRAFT_165147 [Coniophora puteana RWD-64-598 SS2]EIW80901.1 hypothetical protein CONPUDRAFT_165147 [Coniophora puteana RWD-64-598 SS2]